MIAADMLELQELRFVEGSYADLADPASAEAILRCCPEEGRLCVDENEDLLAVAFRQGEHWTGANFLFHPPDPAVIDLFAETEGEIYQEKREDWHRALREYFSLSISRDVRPAFEDIPPDRVEKCRSLLHEVWGERNGERCLDCCCGSGIGAIALRSIGMRPLAYDHDPALLSLGLERGRLQPEETACIDATVVSTYFSPAPYGAAFMLGTIRSFDQEIWEGITAELLYLAGDVLITTATEEEIRDVAGWCRDAGRSPEVWENERDALYDRWVCRA
ncbi:class I SAM-dependent methyltransferase [Methanofollis fontis]|uniref:Methyltransferase domain-containing protein n=1 Tax=Methanofollis fontis TaxID=2052832 RepID=A0A483CR20_9EURY|nr:hypothetical protein [Methanofollis fontis]TAJ43478.1 hypothetical protein CUJ86_10840 [Methanofollis fontis]